MMCASAKLTTALMFVNNGKVQPLTIRQWTMNKSRITNRSYSFYEYNIMNSPWQA